MLSGRSRFLAIAFLSLGIASAKDEAVEPGRRKTEQDVKQGVSAELQKQIDQAIEKARKYLMDGCAGSGFAKRRAEQLEAQVKQYADLVVQYRKQAADAKAKGGKDAAQVGQFEQTANSLEQNAKSFDQQAQALRKSIAGQEAKAGTPEPPLYESLQFGLGEEALIGLALLQAGVSPYDPMIQRIWKDQYSQPIPTQHTTYAVGLQLMLVDAMMHAPCGDAWPEGRPKAKDVKKSRKAMKESLDSPIRKDEVLAWIQKRVDALAGAAQGGAWGYTLTGYGVAAAPSKGAYRVGGDEGPEIGSPELVKMVTDAKGQYDYSNTQYAVLGLKAAALCGVRPRDSDALWRQVLQQFLTGQKTDGKEVMLLLEAEGGKGRESAFLKKGWEEVDTGGGRRRKARSRGWGYTRYQAPKPPVPGQPQVQQMEDVRATMTAAGLTALLVGRSELKLMPKEVEKVDEGVRDGLAWMQENWTQVAARSGYMIYGLERMGVLGGLRCVGGHDWYVEGAKTLIQGQAAEGNWPGGYSLPVETSLCLLFLTRGTREAYARPSYDIGELAPEKPKP